MTPTTPHQIALIKEHSCSYTVKELTKLTGLSKTMIYRLQRDLKIENPKRLRVKPEQVAMISPEVPTRELMKKTGMSKQLVNYYKRRQIRGDEVFDIDRYFKRNAI